MSGSKKGGFEGAEGTYRSPWTKGRNISKNETEQITRKAQRKKEVGKGLEWTEENQGIKLNDGQEGLEKERNSKNRRNPSYTIDPPPAHLKKKESQRKEGRKDGRKGKHAHLSSRLQAQSQVRTPKSHWNGNGAENGWRGGGEEIKIKTARKKSKQCQRLLPWIFCTGMSLMIPNDGIFCTEISSLTEYLALIYPYWLNILYWNTPPEWKVFTVISPLTEYFVPGTDISSLTE